jgi:serine/threonine-protein kinase RsbW
MAMPLTLHFEAATLADLGQMRRFVMEGAESLGADALAADDLVIAIDEAATNIIKYGYREEPGPVTIQLSEDHGTLTMRVLDEAPTFDPTTHRRKVDMDLDIGERPFGGMGIHLMFESADRLVHAGRGGTGNDLTFFKALTQERSIQA